MNVIVGASVYPNPALVINIFSTDVIFALEVVNATAVAFEPPRTFGDVLMDTKGALENPEPSLFKNISSIYPVLIIGCAVAVLPTATS